MRKLKSDYILLDLGAGTAANTLDFFIWADTGIIVTTPVPSAILNAYEFAKNAVYRRLFRVLRPVPYIRSIVERTKGINNDLFINTIGQLADCVKDVSREYSQMILDECSMMRISLLMNLVSSEKGPVMTRKLCGIAEQFLSINLRPAGEVPYDAAVDQLVGKLAPVTKYDKEGPFGKSIARIADRIMNEEFKTSEADIINRLKDYGPKSKTESFEQRAVRGHMKKVKTFVESVDSELLSEEPEDEKADLKVETDTAGQT